MNAPKNALAVVAQEAAVATTEYIPSVSLTLEQAKDNFKRLHEVTKELMKPGVDYDTIPGTPKPTLLKPGAEHLLQFFGLGHRVARVEAKEDWDNGFFYYCYRVTVFKTRIMPDGTVIEQVIAECEGSANSKEKRYRNQDVYTIVNTLQKMAIKRALVGATLQATGTSGMFTQDLEDMDDVGNAKAEPADAKRSAPKTAAKAGPGSTRKAAEQELAYILTAIGAKDANAAARKRWGKTLSAMTEEELTAHVIEGRTYLLSKAAESRGVDGDYALEKLAGKGLDEMSAEEFKKLYETLTRSSDAELASLLAGDGDDEELNDAIDEAMANVSF